MSKSLRDLRLELSRRALLRNFGAGALAAYGFAAAAPVIAQPIFPTYPFQLGVASGEAAPDGFVIWTRLAPYPLEPGHGMPAAAVPVEWMVASDAAMRDIVARGEALARPELGHAVHVEVEGLQPGRPYWYRFRAGRNLTIIGRAKTTPAAGEAIDNVRFAVAGCQHYEHGFYTAHRHLAAEEPDFVFCYGDYIYEGRGNRLSTNARGQPIETVREHVGDELYSLEDYRRRYAQYKLDTDLQAAHAAAPWFMTWDDHEIDNNWAANVDQDGTPPALFALRQQAAMQAYYEHMPLRAASLPTGPAMRLYRQARFGDLLDLNLLDTRQYRSDQPCEDRWGVDCDEVSNPGATMLGAAQESWLEERLRSSTSTWQALAQQVMVMDLDRKPGPERTANLDSWAGYRAPRQRLLDTLTRSGTKSAVVLTGDEHQNYAGELYPDGTRPDGAPIATEFVVTSITSAGDGVATREDTAAIQRENPQLKWHNAQRGYAICDVTHERWRTDFVVLDKVSTPGGVASIAKSFVVEPDQAGLHNA